MERLQMFQNLCQLGVLLCVIIGGFCTYGSSYFGRKKEEFKKIETTKIDTTNNSGNIYNINGDYVENKKEKKIYNQSINAPNALIITKDQKGGQNTVNIYGGNPTPADMIHKPIFEKHGHFGLNILNPEITSITKDTAYSFLANIPDSTKLKITLSKHGVEKQALWKMDAFSGKNWRHNIYKDGEQEFNLDDKVGELEIFFQESGSATMKIYFNDTLVNSKVINWR